MKLEEIDTSTTAGKAEVMRLAAEGRRVAVRKRLPLPSTWFTSVAEAWNWFEYDYAIISEPVGPEEVWVVIQADGSVLVTCDTKERAESVRGNNLRVVQYLRADLAGEAN